MGPIELVAVGVWSFAVSLTGGIVGLVLGNLRLPLLVVVGSSPAAAAGANIAISGLAATTSAVAHGRAGRFDRRLFAWMAPASVAGAVAGGLVSGVLPERLLLACIAVIVLYGAWEVGRGGVPARGGGGPSVRRMAWEAAAIGLVIGVLGGIVGLILGSMRLPAIVRRLGIAPHDAVGTNAAVGVTVGAGGLAGHLPSGVDWELLLVAAVPAMVGAWLGARLTGRLDAAQLIRAIAAVMVVSGAALGVQAVVG